MEAKDKPRKIQDEAKTDIIHMSSIGILHWDILNGFSAEGKEFRQTARTASNKKNYHQMRIYHVLGSVIWVIYSSTNLHFPLADKETKTHREVFSNGL